MIDSEVRRYIDDILAGRSNACGAFTLAANPATSTAVERRGISSGSVVLPVPYSAHARYSDITNIVPDTDGFVVNHAASTSTRTFRYTFSTGVTS